MAEDLRSENPGLIEVRRGAIVAEAHRQSESCLYTSTMLLIWLRWVRAQRRIVVALPVLLGGAATFTVLQDLLPPWVIGLAAATAALIPALADALEIQTGVDETTRLAAEFKALQDRFRRLATVTALGDVEAAERALAELMDRMDLARSSSITPPEWTYLAAKQKIERGDYSFAVDTKVEVGGSAEKDAR